MLPGDHGKGCYTGQGRLVFANNGRGGVLAEWDGSGDIASPGAWTNRRPEQVHRRDRAGRRLRGARRDSADLGDRLGRAVRAAGRPRRRQVDPLSPPESELHPRRRPRLVHRVAADPRGRRRTSAHEHARHVLRFPEDFLRRQDRRNPADLDLPQDGGGLHRLERPPGDGQQRRLAGRAIPILGLPAVEPLVRAVGGPARLRPARRLGRALGP